MHTSLVIACIAAIGLAFAQSFLAPVQTAPIIPVHHAVAASVIGRGQPHNPSSAIRCQKESSMGAEAQAPVAVAGLIETLGCVEGRPPQRLQRQKVYLATRRTQYVLRFSAASDGS